VVIDGQRKGTGVLDAMHHEKQAAFLHAMGLDELIPAPPWAPMNEALTI
jgi:hypothetical protein